ncbi:MAG: RNA polymerase sigma-70 factor [Methanosarcina sp.]
MLYKKFTFDCNIPTRMLSRQFLESTLLYRLKEGDHDAFTVIFTTYYKDLVIFAMNFLKQREIAEEIVQDIFVRLWDNSKTLSIDNSLKSYLLKCVQNSCFDLIRHNKIVQRYNDEIGSSQETFEFNTDNYVINSELEDLLKVALDKLSPEIYEAYCLSRYKGLRYKDIAVKMKVSVRTVEVRIGKALVILRDELKDYLS